MTTIVLIILIISSILFGCSWDTVEPVNIALKCNSFSKKCDTTKVYGPGRYLIGVANYFIEFPHTLQNIEFSDYPYATSGPL